MGSGLSKSEDNATFIIDAITWVGEEVLNEYNTRSFLGKLLSNLAAPARCQKPQIEAEMDNYMSCLVNRANREQAEQTLIICLILIILLGFVIALAIRWTRRLIKNIRRSAQNEIINLQTNSRPLIAPTTQSRAREDETRVELLNRF